MGLLSRTRTPDQGDAAMRGGAMTTRYTFHLPDVGEGVAEAEIVAWHVKPGSRLEEDQPMVDVMTNKATVEMTSPVTGTVVAVHGEIGQLMAVGSPLLELDLAEDSS